MVLIEKNFLLLLSNYYQDKCFHICTISPTCSLSLFLSLGKGLRPLFSRVGCSRHRNPSPHDRSVTVLPWTVSPRYIRTETRTRDSNRLGWPFHLSFPRVQIPPRRRSRFLPQVEWPDKGDPTSKEIRFFWINSEGPNESVLVDVILREWEGWTQLNMNKIHLFNSLEQ